MSKRRETNRPAGLACLCHSCAVLCVTESEHTYLGFFALPHTPRNLFSNISTTELPCHSFTPAFNPIPSKISNYRHTRTTVKLDLTIDFPSTSLRGVGCHRMSKSNCTSLSLKGAVTTFPPPPRLPPSWLLPLFLAWLFYRWTPRDPGGIASRSTRFS